MAEITVKQGDTIEWPVTVSEGGVAVDITDWSIRAQIRYQDTLTQTLTVTKTDAPNGQFALSATATQTDGWTTSSTHQCDIEFTDANGDVFSTQTIDVIVQVDVTHD